MLQVAIVLEYLEGGSLADCVAKVGLKIYTWLHAYLLTLLVLDKGRSEIFCSLDGT